MPKLTRIAKVISYLVLLTTVVVLYTWLVVHVYKGGGRLKPLAKIVKAFAEFPVTTKKVFTEELRGIPPTYMKRDQDMLELNQLKEDVYSLNSFYQVNKDIWEIRLSNLKNDSIIHTWELKKEIFQTMNHRQFENSDPRNSIITKGKSLVLISDGTNNIYLIDNQSNLIWKNTEKVYHHSLNLDSDSTIWVCSSDVRSFKDEYRYRTEGLTTYNYVDDYITQIELATGKIKYDKSVSEILIENGYSNFVYGFSDNLFFKDYKNQHATRPIDPIHLNDIEPIFNDSRFWKRGDLLISLRHPSLVFLYRPSTNKILRLVFGPFLNQHDVDIHSDSTISIFNNNITHTGIKEKIEGFTGAIESEDLFQSSNIVIYDFTDSTFTYPLEDLFIEEKISTWSQGFHQFLSSGNLFIEEQNDGKIFIFDSTQVILRKQFDTEISGYIERPHWIRIYETINF